LTTPVSNFKKFCFKVFYACPNLPSLICYSLIIDDIKLRSFYFSRYFCLMLYEPESLHFTASRIFFIFDLRSLILVIFVGHHFTDFLIRRTSSVISIIPLITQRGFWFLNLYILLYLDQVYNFLSFLLFVYIIPSTLIFAYHYVL